jgi:predicted dithiol-disulfide oxidoreductase (DUF899 family)
LANSSFRREGKEVKVAVENHEVVSEADWLKARKKLLAKERKFTRLQDELSLERRSLPWVKVAKEYIFDGPSGKQTLADLFEGRRQLVIYHFMFGPDDEAGCRTARCGPTVSTASIWICNTATSA